MYRSPYSAPVVVTLPFGVPGNYSAGYHTGIDLVGQGDKTLMSSVDGVVARSGVDSSYGNFVILRESSTGRSFLYAHLSRISVSQGGGVSTGQTIGIEGSTGNSTGSHLHFEVSFGEWAYGKNLLNPADYVDFNDYLKGGEKVKIFINAGHGPSSTGGSYDPGAVGATGLQEAGITLKIGQLLNNKLKTVCTSVLYQDANLTAICNESNVFGADLFVSIHCNAATVSTASGLETYCYQFGGQGEKLARSVQTQLIKFLGRADRGVKEGNFQVLRNTKAPAILTEIGFISNPQEEALMKGTEWLENAAEALAIGISNYAGLGYKQGAPLGQAPEPAKELFRVQVGAYSSRENAEAMLTRIKEAGFTDAFVRQG